MSLIKQLWLAIILILALASSGSFILSTLSGKQYLEKQLQMKNNDNAVTLALSMTQMPKDPIILDLLISAQFDSGHYQYIKLTDPNGNILSERVNSNSEKYAPAWFVNLIPLNVDPGIADIQDGWTQFGTLALESNSTFAYRELWYATIQIALWVLLIGLISCYLGGQLLKKILKPLNDVVNQAKAIGESRFIMIKVPKTKEFKDVVKAMNTLSNRVKKTVSEESARLDQLRLDNNFDHVTGLMNHDYFVKKVNASISHEEYFNNGVMVITRILNIAEIDQKLGYKETNHLLKTIGDALQHECNQNPALSASRLSGADFSVFSNQPVDCYSLGTTINSAFEKMSNITGQDISVNFLTISTRVTKSDSAENLINSVHHVLDDIGAESSNNLHVINSGELHQYQDHNLQEWKNLLTSALDNNRIKLESYPVINQVGELIHYESPVRLQLTTDGKWFCAGEFITWADKLNLINRVDELVLQTAINSLANGAMPIGLNISASAICNPAFIDIAMTSIKNQAQVANKLYFEVPEQSAFDHFPEFRQFCIAVKALGCKVGIEHVGTRISRLGELHDIGLDYIKIDASVIRDINKNEANKTLLRGLCMIAHSIGVIAIAEGVQNDDEISTLKLIGIDGMTGPGISL
ncbi:MAG: EAL domain-containing protein [Methylotenera sp.]|uniref:bifunctional diguanylate cyclase/phosphodiesterase n=1 Tax=Methylotenera sp. TaxID=2051956 RepID=UPI00271DA0B5|nr:EAL domain-containing protein [Methylotenera sp.]MDO9150846.1 EAL domain-containing protein [Methylotenera sp.]